jgi:VWFA-related protein
MRTRTVLFLTFVGLSCSWLALRAGGQQTDASGQAPESDKPVTTLKMQVNEVALPVTVRDKHGALVNDLQKSDFTLTEEGRPQTIKGFTRDPNLPFRIGLLVDTSRSVSGAMDAERKAAGGFVDLMLPEQPAQGKETPKNQAFLIHFDHEVELLEDFTSSREKLHQDLEAMGPSSASRNDTQGPETTGEDRERPNRHGGTQLYDAIYLASDEVMSSKDGRKALIIFSDGLDRGSKVRLNEAVDAAEKANVAIYTIYFKGEQEHSGNFGYPGGGHHGGGYPGGGYPGGGYPGGGYPGGGYPGGGGRGGNETGVDGKKIMLTIAERTGGHAFDAHKKEDLQEIYKLISDELHGQYLLTYTPDKLDNDGGFRKISLKANKPDLVVVTREGYFAPGGEASR